MGKLLLSVCLVIRDGAGFLSRTLNSVKRIADEIVIVDTGSLDGTGTIAREYGARLYSFNWDFDLTAARSYALKLARSKWVLFLEQEEELGDDSAQLRPLLRETESDGFYLPLINFRPGRELEMPSLTLRLFQQKVGPVFVGQVNQEISAIILKKSRELCLRVLQLPIIKNQGENNRGGEEINPGDFYSFGGEDPLSNRFLQEGFKLYKKGKKIQALYKLERELEKSPVENQALLLQNIIFLLLEARQYRQAERMIKRGVEIFPGQAVFLFWQGFLFYQMAEYKEALESLDDLLSGRKISSQVLKTGVYILIGMSYKKMADLDKARFYLEYPLNYQPENRLIQAQLIDLLPGRGGEEVFRYLAGRSKDNPELRVFLVKLFYRKGRYEDALALSGMYPADSGGDELLYWQGKLQIQLQRYAEAARVLKRVSPGSIYYQETLDLLWLLNLLRPAMIESRSVVNQIKLLGDKLSWQIINLFNQIYFYEKEVWLEFNNLVAKLRFYRRSLYYLNLFLEFENERAVEVMLEIIRTLKIRTMAGDLGRLFYGHSCWRQAYYFLKKSLRRGLVLDELALLADCCFHLGKDEEGELFYSKIDILDPYLLHSLAR